MVSVRLLLPGLAAVGAMVFGGCVERREPAGPNGTANPHAPAGAPAVAPPQRQQPATVEGYFRDLADAPGRTQRQLDLAQLQRAVEMFSAVEGRYPHTLEELIEKRILPALPAAPEGKQLAYDPQTGRVSLTP